MENATWEKLRVKLFLYFIHRVGVIKTTTFRKLLQLSSSGKRTKPNLLGPLVQV